MDRLLLSLVLIFVSLAFGLWHRTKSLKRDPSFAQEERLAHLRNRLQFVAFFLFIPCSALLSLWGMPRPDERLLLYPLLGIAAWTIGGVASLIYAKLARLSNAMTGSLFCCGCFSNIGAVGTLVCVVFWGEQTIAYCALYRLCEELYYYGLALPFAARFKGKGASCVTLEGIGMSRLLAIVLCALGLGLLLNFLHIPRPLICKDISASLSIAACVFALYSIGLGLRITKLPRYVPNALAICAIKFCLVPASIVSLGFFLGLREMDTNLALNVALILASMPVAMNALLPPALLDLDLDLANCCWIVSTVALIIVLPIEAIFILPALT